MTDYGKLKADLYKRLGIDLNAYKEQQMRRRINQWLDRHNLGSYNGLVSRIDEDPQHKLKFLEYLTINTSNFFRDTNVFKVIEEEVIPAISKNKRPRIWSAGASIGAEIYSISILLMEYNFRASYLLGTDLDKVVLEKARSGVYLPNQIVGVKPEYLKKYFHQQEDGNWVIEERVKQNVTLKKHDLLRDAYEKNFDLILCRNVFIYFTSETQARLIKNFVDSLQPNGYFIVGSAEQIMDPASFNLKRVSYCIYQKVN